METPVSERPVSESGRPICEASDFPAQYHPTYVEGAWAKYWEKAGLYHTDTEKAAEDPDTEKFVIVIPPPNVTGNLHLGHALTCSIEDCLCRWHRMCGHHTVWIPGTDHAGIATQVVVEKRIQREMGKSRHDLGREDFLKEVWKWKDAHGDQICHQLRKLGASVDWERLVFTMDEGRVRAVKEAFVRMHESGLIYRGTRLVNWCCKLNTAISDIEVDYIDLTKRTMMPVPGHDPTRKYEFGCLTSFAYPIEGGEEGECLVVATTRLETMLGDTAVAIHPEDPRYSHLHGKFVIHPFNKRRIPIILDAELVDMEFGTGAVKITPAHDPNDFLCGKRHNLEMINILNDDGTLNDNGAPFSGMMRFDARYSVGKELERMGLFRGKENNVMRLGICSRSKDVIEPMLKPQWWVDCKDMSARSVAVVQSDELKIVPAFHKPTWFRWLENPQDWCISRQLWWGHRIPAYYASLKTEGSTVSGTTEEDCERWFVGRTEEEALETAAAKLGVPKEEITLVQDEDVLDTWFSSGLFPFSVLGWPDETSDLSTFFPTQLLETGHDILFFWVARMVMMSLQLTDRLPFDTVYLHAMVRDKYGRKMSKSLGNVIDPLEVISGCSLEHLIAKLHSGNLPEKEIKKAEKGQRLDFPEGIPECGADALRFGLLAYTIQGRDINLDIKRVVGYRQFCNKLWNAVKFAMLTIPEDGVLKSVEGKSFAKMLAQISEHPGLSLFDRWILSKLAACIVACDVGMRAFTFGTVTAALHNWWLHELCDVYLEAIKPIMRSGSDSAKEAAQRTLYICLDIGLRLLHPIMPFVTEELWQRLPGRTDDPECCDSIMTASYPQSVDGWANPGLEAAIELVLTIIHEMRSLCSLNKILANKKPSFSICAAGEPHDIIAAQIPDIVALSKAGSVILLPKIDDATSVAPPKGCAVGVVNEKVKLFLNLKGMIDVSVESKRLKKELAKVEKIMAGDEKNVSNPAWQAKVPQKVKDTITARLEASKQQQASLLQALANLKELE